MILKSDLINYSISISSSNWTRLIPSQIPKVEFKSKSGFFTLSGQWRESVRVMQWMKTQTFFLTPHRELGWFRALPHKKAVDSGFEPPGGILGSILTRSVLRDPQGIMRMRKRIDHPWVIKKKKKDADAVLECRGGPHAGLLTVTRTATIGAVHYGLEYRACYILHQPETTLKPLSQCRPTESVHNKFQKLKSNCDQIICGPHF